MSSCLFLVKAGYGSLKEVEKMDTDVFLDCLEYEKIRSAIEEHLIEKAQNE